MNLWGSFWFWWSYCDHIMNLISCINRDRLQPKGMKSRQKEKTHGKTFFQTWSFCIVLFAVLPSLSITHQKSCRLVIVLYQMAQIALDHWKTQPISNFKFVVIYKNIWGNYYFEIIRWYKSEVKIVTYTSLNSKAYLMFFRNS